MDKQELSGFGTQYMQFSIPPSILTFLQGQASESLTEALTQELRTFLWEVLSENKEVMEENGKLAAEASEWSDRFAVQSATAEKYKYDWEIAEQKLAKAISAGYLLADELLHKMEVGNSMNRFRFGTRSERRKRDKNEFEPIIDDDDDGREDDPLSEIEESIVFFCTKAQEEASKEEEERKQACPKPSKAKAKAGTKGKGKKDSADPKPKTEKAEPSKVIFENLDPEELYGGHGGCSLEDISKYLETVRKELGGKTVRAENVEAHMGQWKKCTEGHFSKALANCDHRSRIIDIYGSIVEDAGMLPESIEVEGYTLKLVGLKEVHYEVEQIEIRFPVVHEMQAMYKVALEGTNRPEEILKAQEALGKYGVVVDGAKKARETLYGSDIMELEASTEPEKTEPEVLCPDDNIIAEEGTMEDQNIQGGAPEDSVAHQDEGTSGMEPEKLKKQEEERKKEEKRIRERERQRMKAAKKREVAGKPPKSNAERPPRMQTFLHSAKKTVSLIGKSIWSPALVAMVLSIMFGLVVPGYRLATTGSFLLGGINIPVSTVSAMAILVYEKKLKYLLSYFYEDLVAMGYIQADETTLRVLRSARGNQSAKSYVWIYSSMAFSPVQIRIFDYEPGRSGQFCKAFLASFAGVLLTDAYQGYNLVDNVIHAFCFIHFRRKIYDAYVSGSSYYVRSKAKLALDLIDLIFKIEEELQGQGLIGEALAAERERRMRPLIQNLNCLVKIIKEDKHISKKSKLFLSIQYYTNHYVELTYFLKDGYIPMHNQNSELGARAVSLHRNNSFFRGSPRGAIAFCGILSVVETAKANNLDVYKYFLFLFRNMRGDDFYKDKELMRSLLPYSERAKSECSSDRPKKAAKIRLKGGQTAA